MMIWQTLVVAANCHIDSLFTAAIPAPAARRQVPAGWEVVFKVAQQGSVQKPAEGQPRSERQGVKQQTCAGRSWCWQGVNGSADRG